jgi:hypothetical protein
MINERLSKYVMKAMNPPEILPAGMGEDVVCLGASLLAKDIFSGQKL